MESVSALKISQILKKKNIRFLTNVELMRLLDVKSRDTARKMLQRLEKKQILQRAALGKYIVREAKIGDFQLANFVLQPSYISFESALAYYSILSQFPFCITSATTKKSKKLSSKKELEYTHIKKSLYWGFVKDKNFVIATPEKALLDTLYLASRGQRTANLDEYNLDSIDKKVLNVYLKKVQNKAFETYLEKNYDRLN